MSDDTSTADGQQQREGYVELRYHQRGAVRYEDDCRRLRDALNELGWDASLHDIGAAYSNYSEDSWAAGWMSLPESDAQLRIYAEELVEHGYLRST
jgi:hypothetical protein